MEITAHTFDCAPAYRAQLDALMADTFGFTFAGWDGPLGWNADYTSYALQEDGQLLAHAGLYRMDLLVRGTRRTAYQIGGVATRAERRGQGLSRRLIEHILAQQPGALFFLFAGEHMRGFYEKFGFHQVVEHQPYVEIAPDKPPAGLRRLNLADPCVAAYLLERQAFSAVLDCANAAPLNWFHLRLEYADHLYEIPALRALLAARQQGSTLALDGLWSPKRLVFADLAPYLAMPGVQRVQFGFNPDWLDAPFTMTEAESAGLYVRGMLEVGEPFLFPLLAVT